METEKQTKRSLSDYYEELTENKIRSYVKRSMRDGETNIKAKRADIPTLERWKAFARKNGLKLAYHIIPPDSEVDAYVFWSDAFEVPTGFIVHVENVVEK